MPTGCRNDFCKTEAPPPYLRGRKALQERFADNWSDFFTEGKDGVVRFRDAFAITPILRDLPPQNEFVVRWNGHRFSRFDADPTAIEGREKPKEKKTKSAGFIPGSYREMFAQMPPLKHDKDPELSEVLNHIAAELNANGKNEDHAQTVFDVIRQPRRKIIRYSQKSRCWVGVHYQETREGGHND